MCTYEVSRILNGFPGASIKTEGVLRDLHASIGTLKSSMGPYGVFDGP